MASATFGTQVNEAEIDALADQVFVDERRNVVVVDPGVPFGVPANYEYVGFESSLSVATPQELYDWPTSAIGHGPGVWETTLARGLVATVGFGVTSEFEEQAVALVAAHLTGLVPQDVILQRTWDGGVEVFRKPRPELPSGDRPRGVVLHVSADRASPTLLHSQPGPWANWFVENALSKASFADHEDGYYQGLEEWMFESILGAPGSEWSEREEEILQTASTWRSEAQPGPSESALFHAAPGGDSFESAPFSTISVSNVHTEGPDDGQSVVLEFALDVMEAQVRGKPKVRLLCCPVGDAACLKKLGSKDSWKDGSSELPLRTPTRSGQPTEAFGQHGFETRFGPLAFVRHIVPFEWMASSMRSQKLQCRAYVEKSQGKSIWDKMRFREKMEMHWYSSLFTVTLERTPIAPVRVARSEDGLGLVLLASVSDAKRFVRMSFDDLHLRVVKNPDSDNPESSRFDLRREKNVVVPLERDAEYSIRLEASEDEMIMAGPTPIFTEDTENLQFRVHIPKDWEAWLP